MCARSVIQLCPTLRNPKNCSPPGFSVHGILQARILERVAISYSRGSSWPGIEPKSLATPALVGGFFTTALWMTQKYNHLEDACIWQCMPDTWSNMWLDVQRHVCIFESLQLEGSYVGDLLYWKNSEAGFLGFFADNQERSPEQHQWRGLLVNVFEKRIHRMVWAWCGEKDCKRNWKESGNSDVTFHHNREPETCRKDCRTLARLGSKGFGSVQSQKPLGWPASLRCLSVKESACQCRRRQRHAFNPWVRKMPLQKKWQLTLVFSPWESHGAWWAAVHGIGKSRTRLSD